MQTFVTLGEDGFHGMWGLRAVTGLPVNPADLGIPWGAAV
ncbi:hypothetical protein BIFGAL_03341 [Bifidobacterium gallicum DSM 20093 = LMG 11596]|uniref:Uncharacterized protein n=1 Tax=Bifidobacterium gallicum DSM 20093 = LMG 11596 TaxID=561180 RepID=D1NU20_9BIFI|nr:hypothetical protein BIFGAL_03341 [Bifidobacterium gallicum DSM 20093 = LMG 11596]